MNPIKKILEDHQVTQEKVVDLFTTFKSNPMEALMKFQALGLPQEKLQEMMGLIMSSATLFEETVKEYGLDLNEVLEAQKKAEEFG